MGIHSANDVGEGFAGIRDLGEDLMKPTSMLYRNLVAMELEESLLSQPLDAVVVPAACDKSVPGALIGAFSANVPVLLLVSGRRPVAVFEGRRSCPGRRRCRARRSADIVAATRVLGGDDNACAIDSRALSSWGHVCCGS